jgi:predicted naringenin-chalcone synthase
MGCYAAIHALKMADMICKTEKDPKVLIVCTELCTLHFQKEPTMDNIASSLLFGDGSAAVLVVPDDTQKDGITIKGFYSEVAPKGKKDMSWELSSSGFLMTLSGYVPDLIEEDFDPMICRALRRQGLDKNDILHWCIHPGGKRILESIEKSLGLEKTAFQNSYDVLNDFGNMSSPTVLFVLERFLQKAGNNKPGPLIAAAFGPGLTMETFTAIA